MSVRVRLAPSPTGEIHIGSVRTFLYNHLFAKQNDGTLVLRIEDTDRSRFDPRALESVYDGLRWLGISWDEGPREGGPHEPYVQSERLEIYQRHARELVAKGAAYHCFCSKERLEQIRKEQTARGEITKYDRHCRRIDPREAADRASREPHVVRLKVPDEGTAAIDDLVHGHVEWPLNVIEDQVILKSDGYPTYHLAVVIDDTLMGITHILRAEEWLASVPKHLLIYGAFGWTPPPMGHLPDVLGPDGKKLSKRHGATSVAEFQRQGFIPEALVNYIALVGWAPGSEDEVFSMDELVTRWRIDQVQKAGGKWDVERLKWFNGVWIRRLADDDLAARLDGFIPAEWDRRLVRTTIPHIKERMEMLTQAKDLIGFLFEDPSPAATSLIAKQRTAAETRGAFERARAAIAAVRPFESAAIRSAVQMSASTLGWTERDVAIPIRVAVTGSKVGFGLYESIELLGRERAIARIQRAEAALD